MATLPLGAAVELQGIPGRYGKVVAAPPARRMRDYIAVDFGMGPRMLPRAQLRCIAHRFEAAQAWKERH